MSKRRVRYVWEGRDSPQFTLQDEQKKLGQLVCRRDGLRRTYVHEIDDLHAYLMRHRNEVWFTWGDEVRVDKAIADIELLRQAMEDRYAELIPRQILAVERRRASLVAFGMIGGPKNEQHVLHGFTDLIDLILILASA